MPVPLSTPWSAMVSNAKFTTYDSPLQANFWTSSNKLSYQLPDRTLANLSSFKLVEEYQRFTVPTWRCHKRQLNPSLKKSSAYVISNGWVLLVPLRALMDFSQVLYRRRGACSFSPSASEIARVIIALPSLTKAANSLLRNKNYRQTVAFLWRDRLDPQNSLKQPSKHQKKRQS